MTQRLPASVVLSGVGLHGAFGDRSATHEALAAGRSALRAVELPDVRALPPCVGAPATDAIPAGRYLEGAARKLLKYASPTSAMAIAAAGAALEDAGLKDGERRARLGLYVAAGLIAFDVGEVRRGIEAVASDGQIDPRRVNEGLRRCHPLMPFKMLLNMPLGLVSIAFGLRGPNAMLYPGAEQGAAALELALRAIATGRLEAALVGATTHALSLLPLCTLARLGCLATDAENARPGSATQRGLAPADGAAFLLLESAESAAARGARIHAVLGGATSRVGRPGDDPSSALQALLRRVPATITPQRLLRSGTASAAEDEALRQGLAARWPTAQLESFDAQLGYHGAAALPWTLALACRADGAPLFVVASDPRGALGAVWTRGTLQGALTPARASR